MAIKFDFYRTPPIPGEVKDAKEQYYARVVGGQTVDMDHMIPHIQQRCTLSKGDITAVIDELGVELVNQLCDGNHVYFPGIGYFSLSLSAPKDSDPVHTHNQHIRIKKVEFRADQHLKDALKEQAKFKRAEVKQRQVMLSDEEIEQLLRDAFRETPYLSRPDFAELTGLSRAMSQQFLNRLISEGKVVKKGSFRFPTYHPTPMFMRCNQ